MRYHLQHKKLKKIAEPKTPNAYSSPPHSVSECTGPCLGYEVRIAQVKANKNSPTMNNFITSYLKRGRGSPTPCHTMTAPRDRKSFSY